MEVDQAARGKRVGRAPHKCNFSCFSSAARRTGGYAFPFFCYFLCSFFFFLCWAVNGRERRQGAPLWDRPFRLGTGYGNIKSPPLLFK